MKVVRRSSIRTLVGHFLESIKFDLEQNIWWGIRVRAITALKQHNSEVIVDLARPFESRVEVPHTYTCRALPREYKMLPRAKYLVGILS